MGLNAQVILFHISAATGFVTQKPISLNICRIALQFSLFRFTAYCFDDSESENCLYIGSRKKAGCSTNISESNCSIIAAIVWCGGKTEFKRLE